MSARESSGRVLIVDDAPVNLKILNAVLRSSGFEVVLAECGEDALELAGRDAPDLILLDVGMPGIDGFETCRRLKSNLVTREIPVIFMTARTETVDKVKGFDVGAVDYVTKPFEHREVLMRVSTHIRIASLQQELTWANERLEARVSELDRTNAELARLNETLEGQIEERRKAEFTLRAVVEGTAVDTGKRFLRTLARQLAVAMGTSSALVTERVATIPEQARTLAFWHNGEDRTLDDFEVQGTPLAAISRGEFVEVDRDLETSFPGCPWLNVASADSLVGVPIRGTAGDVLGHLCVLDSGGAGARVRHGELLTIFAARAGAELERHRAATDLERTITAYSRFVPREFLELLRRESVVGIELGDQTQLDISILFADIRGFAGISENFSPSETFEFINGYLAAVSPVIRRNHGFIDKYIGDAVMALFPRCADDALRAAIQLQRAVESFNESGAAIGRPAIRVGIGIHSGTAILGVIGGDGRLEGTVLSDAVNTTSRIEGLTKHFGARILVSAESLARCFERAEYSVRYLDEVQVEGKQVPVFVYELLDGEASEQRERKLSTREMFEHALVAYKQGEFDVAREGIEQVLLDNPTDGAARLYMQRCAQQLGPGSLGARDD